MPVLIYRKELPVSHADTARIALQDEIRRTYKPVWDAGTSYSNTYLQVGKATDIVETMQRTVDLVLAASHLAEMAAEAEKTARSILSEQMTETGATSIQTDGHTAYLARKPAFVSVDQPNLVPHELMTQPAPVIDKRAIKAAIESGTEVPGCTIVRPNEFALVIRGRSNG
jgi:hypothetical protein